MKTLKSALGAREAPLDFSGSPGESGNLFSTGPVARRRAAAKRRLALGRKLAPELATAQVLCRQLRRKRANTEKKRLVHLICLNLLAILKRRSQQA